MTDPPESSPTSAPESAPEPLAAADRRRAADFKRARILDAAAAVFAERGFHGSTVRHVAEAAGTSDGSIYNHVGNKDALLMGLLERISARDRRPADFAAAADEPLEAFVRRYTAQRLRELEPGLATLQAVLPEVLARPDLRAAFAAGTLEPSFGLAERYLAERRAAGETDADPELLSRLLAAAVLGLTLLRLLGDEATERRWDELADALASLALDGVRVGADGGAAP